MKVIQRRSQLIGVCVLLSCVATSLTAQRPMPVGIQRSSPLAVTTFAPSLAREPVVRDSGGGRTRAARGDRRGHRSSGGSRGRLPSWQGG